MGQIDQNILKRFAAKYVWWKAPDEAIRQPERVVARVMDIGDYDDVQVLAAQAGDDAFISSFTSKFTPSWRSCSICSSVLFVSIFHRKITRG